MSNNKNVRFGKTKKDVKKLLEFANVKKLMKPHIYAFEDTPVELEERRGVVYKK